MSMFGIMVLSVAIGVGTSQGPASTTNDAYKALAKASYIQTGTDKKVKVIEKNITPKIVKEYGGWIAGIAKIVNDKKISLEWTF
jgi:hypothetical protein